MRNTGVSSAESSSIRLKVTVTVSLSRTVDGPAARLHRRPLESARRCADRSGMETTVDVTELRTARTEVDVALALMELENADLLTRVGGTRYSCHGVWIEHGVVRDTRDGRTGGQCSRGSACRGGSAMDHIRTESCHVALAPCPTCTGS